MLLDLTSYEEGVGHHLGQIRAISALLSAAGTSDPPRQDRHIFLTGEQIADIAQTLGDIERRLFERLDHITKEANSAHKSQLNTG